MTSKEDWTFRAEYLRDQATYLRKKAEEFECEASRFDHLADQAEMFAMSNGDRDKC